MRLILASLSRQVNAQSRRYGPLSERVRGFVPMGRLSFLRVGEPQRSFAQGQAGKVELPVLVWGLLGLLNALGPLSMDLYLPTAHLIQKQFLTTPQALARLYTCYLVGLAVGQLLFGPICDRFGRRRPLVFALGVCAVAALASTSARSLCGLMICRVFEAVGAGAGVVASRAWVKDRYDAQQVGQIYSTLAFLSGLAPLVAPDLGRVLGARLGWQAPFVFCAIAALIAALGVLRYFDEAPSRHDHPSAPFGMRSALATYVALLCSPSFVVFVATSGFLGAGMFVFKAAAPEVLVDILHLHSGAFVGVLFVAALGHLVFAQLNARLLGRFGLESTLRIVAVAAFADALIVATASILPMLWPLFVGGCVLYVWLIGMVFPSAAAAALGRQGHRAAQASAMNGALQWAMATFFTLVLDGLHDGTLRPAGYVICGVASLGFLTIFAFSATAMQSQRA